MPELILEIAYVVILIAILAMLLRVDQDVQHERGGFLFIKIGFLLMLFGAVVNVGSDALNDALPNVSATSLLFGKGIGYLGGILMLAVGLWRWLPSMRQMGRISDDLEGDCHELERQVLARDVELAREVQRVEAIESSYRVFQEQRDALFERSPIPIIQGIVGSDQVERNQAFADMLGYDSPQELEDAIRESGDTFLYWVDTQEVERMLHLQNEGVESHDFKGQLRRKDGSVIWVAMAFCSVSSNDGKNRYFYGFADDITERKAASEALQRREKHLKSVMDAMPAGVLLVDAETMIIEEANIAMMNMTGFSLEDLEGASCCKLLCGHSNTLCEYPGEGDTCEVDKREIQKKDGSMISVLKSMSRLTLDGKAYFLNTLVDISEQQRLEELKSHVDRIVAHDMKAPIIGVINACRLLRMEETNLSEEGTEILKLVEIQSNKVLNLMSMSLTIYRIESGTYEYLPETVNLNEVFGHVLMEQQDKARSLRVEVSVTMDGAPFDAEGYFELSGNNLLLETMFANLLGNAIEASPADERVAVEVTCGEMVVTTITNLGVVPDGIRERFFEKYVTSGKTTGTGIGTYSARLAARAMGGDVTMETSDESGETTLTITMPRA